MLSILTRLGALFSGGLANPYVLLALFSAFVAENGFVAYKSYGLGGDRQRVVCQRRVDDMQKQIADANAKIDAANKKWTDAIYALESDYEKVSAERAAQIAALQEEVKSYESTLPVTPACTLDGNDIKRLR